MAQGDEQILVDGMEEEAQVSQSAQDLVNLNLKSFEKLEQLGVEEVSPRTLSNVELREQQVRTSPLRSPRGELENQQSINEFIEAVKDEQQTAIPGMSDEEALEIATLRVNRILMHGDESAGTEESLMPTRPKPGVARVRSKYGQDPDFFRVRTDPEAPIIELFDAIDGGATDESVQEIIDKLDVTDFDQNLSYPIGVVRMGRWATGRRVFDITEPAPTWQARQENHRQVARDIDAMMSEHGRVYAAGFALGRQTLMTQQEAENMGMDIEAMNAGMGWFDLAALTSGGVLGYAAATGQPFRAGMMRATGQPYLLPFGRSTKAPLTNRVYSWFTGQKPTPRPAYFAQKPGTVGMAEPVTFRGRQLPAPPETKWSVVDPATGRKKASVGGRVKISLLSLVGGAVVWAGSRTVRDTPNFWNPVPIGSGMAGWLKMPRGLVDISTAVQVKTGIADLWVPYFIGDGSKEEQDLWVKTLRQQRPAETWGTLVENVRYMLDKEGATVNSVMKDANLRSQLRGLVMNLSYQQLPDHAQVRDFDVDLFLNLARRSNTDLYGEAGFEGFVRDRTINSALRALLIQIDEGQLSSDPKKRREQIARVLRTIPLGWLMRYFPQLIGGDAESDPDSGVIPDTHSMLNSVLIAAGADIEMLDFTGGGRTTRSMGQAFSNLMMETVREGDTVYVKESTIGHAMRVLGAFPEFVSEIGWIPITPAGWDFDQNLGVRDPNTSYLARVLSNIKTGEMGLARHFTDLMYADPDIDRNDATFLAFANLGIALDWLVPWEYPIQRAVAPPLRGLWRGQKMYRHLRKENKNLPFAARHALIAMSPGLFGRKGRVDLLSIRSTANIRNILDELGQDPTVENLERLRASRHERLGEREINILDDILDRMNRDGDPLSFDDALLDIPQIKDNDLYSTFAYALEQIVLTELNSHNAKYVFEMLPSSIRDEALRLAEIVTPETRAAFRKRLESETESRSKIALTTLEQLITYGDPNLNFTRQSQQWESFRDSLRLLEEAGVIPEGHASHILTFAERLAWKFSLEGRPGVFEPMDVFEHLKIIEDGPTGHPKPPKPIDLTDAPDPAPIEPAPGETPRAPEPVHTDDAPTVETDFGTATYVPETDVLGGGAWVVGDEGIAAEIGASLDTPEPSGLKLKTPTDLDPKSPTWGMDDPVLNALVRGKTDGPWRLRRNEPVVSERMGLNAIITDDKGYPVAAVFHGVIPKELSGQEKTRVASVVRFRSDVPPDLVPALTAAATETILLEFIENLDIYPDAILSLEIPEGSAFADEMSRSFESGAMNVAENVEWTVEKVDDEYWKKTFYNITLDEPRASLSMDPALDGGKVGKEKQAFLTMLEKHIKHGVIDEAGGELIRKLVMALPNVAFKTAILKKWGSMRFNAGGVRLGSWNHSTKQIELLTAKRLHEGRVEEFADMSNEELVVQLQEKLWDITVRYSEAAPKLTKGKRSSWLNRKENLGSIKKELSELVQRMIFDDLEFLGVSDKRKIGLASRRLLERLFEDASEGPNGETGGLSLAQNISQGNRAVVEIRNWILDKSYRELHAQASPYENAVTLVHELTHSLHYSLLPESVIQELRLAYINDAQRGFPGWRRREQFKDTVNTEHAFGEWLADSVAEYLITKKLPESLAADATPAQRSRIKRILDTFVEKLRIVVQRVWGAEDVDVADIPNEVVRLADDLLAGNIDQIATGTQITERWAFSLRGRFLPHLIKALGADTKAMAKTESARNRARLSKLKDIKRRKDSGGFRSENVIIRRMIDDVINAMENGLSYRDAVRNIPLMGRPAGDAPDPSNPWSAAWSAFDAYQNSGITPHGLLASKKRTAPNWIRDMAGLDIVQRSAVAHAMAEQYGLVPNSASYKTFYDYVMSSGEQGRLPRRIASKFERSYSTIDTPKRRGYELVYDNPDDPIGPVRIMSGKDMAVIDQAFRTGNMDLLFEGNGRLIAKLMGDEWYHQFSADFDHVVYGRKPVLTEVGAHRAKEAFRQYVRTMSSPDGLNPRMFDDLYRHLQDYWIKYRGRATVRVEPKVREKWDQFLNPSEVYKSDVAYSTQKVSNTFDTVFIEQDVSERRRAGGSATQTKKKAFSRVDDSPENILQGIGVRPGEDALDPVDLFARLVGYVAGEHMRMLGGYVEDMVPMTTRTIVPRSRVARIREAVRRRQEAALMGMELKPAEGRKGAYQLDDMQAAGMQLLVHTLMREPIGAQVFRNHRLAEWDADFSVLTELELQEINQVLIDVEAGVAARETSYTERIPKSLGYMFLNAAREGRDWGLEKAGERLTPLRKFLSNFQVEKFAGGEMDPAVKDILRKITLKIGRREKEFRALIMKAADEGISFQEGKSILHELFGDLFHAPVDPSKVDIIVGGKQREFSFEELFGEVRDSDLLVEQRDSFFDEYDALIAELDSSKIDDDVFVPREATIDPDGTGVGEEANQLNEVLERLEAIVELVTTRSTDPAYGTTRRKLRDQEREALRILYFYRRRARRAREAGETPSYSEIDRKALGQALHRIKHSLNEKRSAVIERGKVILVSFAGGDAGASFLNTLTESEIALAYKLFYQGRVVELLDWMMKLKIEIPGKAHGPVRYNPAIATLEAMMRLSAYDVVSELTHEMAKAGVLMNRFDILGEADRRIFDPTDTKYVGISEDAFLERVKYWIGETQNFRFTREIMMHEGARAVYPDVYPRWHEKAGLPHPQAGEKIPIEYPRGARAKSGLEDGGASQKGVLPPDEIERGLSLGWPRDTPKTVIDMEAYQTAQRIMSSWGLRPDKRGFDWYTMPDGSRALMPDAVYDEILKAYDRVSQQGGAFTTRKATLRHKNDMRMVGYGKEAVKFDASKDIDLGIGSAVQTVLDLFPYTTRSIRMGVTTGIILPNPAYYTGVFMGGWFQIYQGMGLIGVTRAVLKNPQMTKAVVTALWKDGVSKKGVMLRGEYAPSAPPLVTENGIVYSAASIVEMADAYGLKSSFVYAETVRQLNDDLNRLNPGFMAKMVPKHIRGSAKKWQENLIEFSTAIDNYYRVSVFIDYLERGYTPAHAAERARKFLYDYAELSETEKVVGRNLIMFYSYMRKNMDLFWETLLTNPHRLIGQLRLVRGIQQAYLDGEAEIVLKEYQRTRLPVYFKNTTINTARQKQWMFITPPLPMMDAVNLYVDLFDVGFGSGKARAEAGRMLYTRLTPWIQFPAVAAMDKDPFWDKSLEDYNRVPTWLVELDRGIFGGALVDGFLDITPVSRSHLDPTRADMPGHPEEGWFHAQNGVGWWLWRNMAQWPGAGRSMDTINAIDRANLGAVESLVASVQWAAKKKGGPLLRAKSWEEIAEMRPVSAMRFREGDSAADVMGPRYGLFDYTVTDMMSDEDILKAAIDAGSQYAQGVSLDKNGRFATGEQGDRIRRTLINEIHRKESRKFAPLELLGLLGIRPVATQTYPYAHYRLETERMREIEAETSRIKKGMKRPEYIGVGRDDLEEQYRRRREPYFDVEEDNEN